MKNQDSAKLGELFKGAIDKKIEEISNTSIWNEKPVPPKTFPMKEPWTSDELWWLPWILT